MSNTVSKPARWTAADIPSMRGRTAVVSGANSGIGFETAKALAERGAEVVLACRNLDNAKDAAGRITASAPGANVRILHLDLSSLASVTAAAHELQSGYHRLDLLINNAGVMWPAYSKTADGFELQLGTNHLGHFAFTGRLLDLLMATPGSRIVTISSIGHRTGRINFDDLQSERKYGRHTAYAQSKLANLMFTYELQRRLTAAGVATIAVAAHPGGSDTNLNRHSPTPMRLLNAVIGPLVIQSASMGALPTLRAAADPNVQGNDYYGPDGFIEAKGYPKRVQSNDRSHDVAAQRRLWTISEQLTSVIYPI